MTPRLLVFSNRAQTDIERRVRVLNRQRGQAFAVAWTEALFDWLRGIAETGAQIGTTHPIHTDFRTFGYKRQAAILAEFTDDELRVVRVYFAGQDWSA